MSATKSKKELADAGRRKLEAFRKQKAAQKANIAGTPSKARNDASPAGIVSAAASEPAAATSPPLANGSTGDRSVAGDAAQPAIVVSPSRAASTPSPTGSALGSDQSDTRQPPSASAAVADQASVQGSQTWSAQPGSSGAQARALYSGPTTTAAELGLGLEGSPDARHRPPHAYTWQPRPVMPPAPPFGAHPNAGAASPVAGPSTAHPPATSSPRQSAASISSLTAATGAAGMPASQPRSPVRGSDHRQAGSADHAGNTGNITQASRTASPSAIPRSSSSNIEASAATAVGSTASISGRLMEQYPSKGPPPPLPVLKPGSTKLPPPPVFASTHKPSALDREPDPSTGPEPSGQQRSMPSMPGGPSRPPPLPSFLRFPAPKPPSIGSSTGTSSADGQRQTGPPSRATHGDSRQVDTPERNSAGSQGSGAGIAGEPSLPVSTSARRLTTDDAGPTSVQLGHSYFASSSAGRGPVSGAQPLLAGAAANRVTPQSFPPTTIDSNGTDLSMQQAEPSQLANGRIITDSSQTSTGQQSGQLAAATAASSLASAYGRLSDAYISAEAAGASSHSTAQHGVPPSASMSYSRPSDSRAGGQADVPSQLANPPPASTSYTHLSDTYIGKSDSAPKISPQAGSHSRPGVSGSGSASASYTQLSDSYLGRSEQESEQLGDRPPSTSYAQLSGSYLGKPGHPAEGNSRAAGGEQTSTSYAQLSDSILGRQSGQHQSKGNSNVAGHTATSYGKVAESFPDGRPGSPRALGSMPASASYGRLSDSYLGRPKKREEPQPAAAATAAAQLPNGHLGGNHHPRGDQQHSGASSADANVPHEDGHLPGLRAGANGSATESAQQNGRVDGWPGALSAARQVSNSGVPPSRHEAGTQPASGSKAVAAPASVPPLSGPPSGRSQDFSTLQQYIDDLTQEKFELMRGLEQQRRLAETLAAENMALTEDFNRQGAGFQDVKKLLERYKAEIAAQQMALQSVAAERDACRGGVTESAERIKAVASEVVALEETVLKLRSANLKLERETEQAKGAERKALHLLQTASTDRGSLQAMIEALQEEKRTLSAKLRRATVGSHLQAERPPRDASTQTAAAAEVDTGRLTEVAASAPETQASTPAPAAAALVSVSGRIAAQALAGAPNARAHPPPGLLPAVQQLLPRRPRDATPGSSADSGPAGQLGRLADSELQAVEAIHELLGALEQDKRHMLGALEARLAQVAQLQAANGELRYKLESMTQRFELAVAQSSFAAAAAAAQADGEGYVKSANVTPQPMPRRPLRAPREEQRSGGVLTWLAHLVAPPPPQRLTARRLV